MTTTPSLWPLLPSGNSSSSVHLRRMMHLCNNLFVAFLGLYVTVAIPFNSSLILPLSGQLEPSSYNTSLTSWPPTPYTITLGSLQITISNYGRSASAHLMPEIQLGLDDLRRRILRDSDRFSGAPIIISSDIVTLSINFRETPSIARIGRKDIANVISALTLDMKTYGPEEVKKAVVGTEVHRTGAFIPAAEISLTFEQLEDSAIYFTSNA